MKIFERKEPPPAEKIVEAREKAEQGFFNRAIVNRVPTNIHYDTVHLECGHAVPRWPRSLSEEPVVSCDVCVEAWLSAEPEPQP